MPLSRHNKTNHHDSASSQLHQPCLVFLRKNLAQHFIAFYIVAFRGKAVASSTNFSCCLLGAQHPTASTKTTKNLRILNLNTSNYQTSPIMSEQKAKEIEMGASKTAEKTKKTASSGGHGDAYSGAISNRAIQKKKTRLNEMNTKRGFDTDTRTACQKKTDSSCMDWGVFVCCFLTLYLTVAGLFALFLELFMASRSNDLTLWIWFLIQITFVTGLICAILTNPVVKKLTSDIENPVGETKTE